MPLPGTNIKTAEEIRKDRILYGKNLGDLQDLEDCLDSIDSDRESHLSEELKGFVENIGTIRRVNSTPSKTVEDALNAMKGFADFLAKEKGGKTNYQRLMDDASRADRQYNAETIKKGIAVLNELGFEIDTKTLEERQKTLNPDPDMARRKPNTVSIDTYDKFLTFMKDKDKTIFDYNSRDYKSVSNLIKHVGRLKDNLDKQIENNRDNTKEGLEKNIQNRALLDDLGKLHENLKTVEQIAAGMQHSKEMYEQFSNAMKGINDFLKEGEKSSRYQRISQVEGFEKKVFENGFNTIERNLKLGINMTEVADYKPRVPKSKDALDWIDDMKKNLKATWNTEYGSVEQLRDTITKIMAARILADSIPGDKESLKKTVTDVDIEKKAEELSQDEHFYSFLVGITNNADLQEKTFRVISKERTHGGDMEKMFTKYLTQQDPGALSNSPVIARFMPRVIDRIEELQNQSKKGSKSMQESAAGEILALRQMIQVGRDQKDALKVKIPADGKLKENALNITETAVFQKFMQNKENRALIFSGHGGEAQKVYNDSKNLKPSKKLAVPKNPGGPVRK